VRGGEPIRGSRVRGPARKIEKNSLMVLLLDTGGARELSRLISLKKKEDSIYIFQESLKRTKYPRRKERKKKKKKKKKSRRRPKFERV